MEWKDLALWEFIRSYYKTPYEPTVFYNFKLKEKRKKERKYFFNLIKPY